MKPTHQGLRLRTEVFVWRHGAIWLLIPLLLFTSLLLQAAQLFYFEPRINRAQTQVHSLEAELKAILKQTSTPTNIPTDTTHQAGSELQKVLVAHTAVPEVIRALHSSAARHGIAVLSAEFQRQAVGQTGVIQQSVVMPFRASYPQAKSFLFDVLRSNSGLSLDQITIKREAVAQANPEIKVKFSIWVAADGGPLATPASAGASER